MRKTQETILTGLKKLEIEFLSDNKHSNRGDLTYFRPPLTKITNKVISVGFLKEVIEISFEFLHFDIQHFIDFTIVLN